MKYKNYREFYFDWVRSCRKKRKYLSSQKALDAIMHIVQAEGFADLYPYRCNFCNYYHFGHMSKDIFPKI